ncbi:probable serine/threonine-protein kinase DDB_G0288147 [Vespula pensylvanica]|uniref:probable serine/threonine-protein kinase DDB_G0288147 n=1 Tax=Vespula pensylvanica TaxID=30213 RepID=UPI001CBA5207|nr:probable serine/threonine-protein kinase DDB_G0288147 [Vespula pensylvanica]
MAKLPPLNYFMEKEAADVAIKHFNLILQEALKEYTNVWARYLNFVNQYQEDNSRSLSEEKTRIERQKDENNKSSRSIYLEEPHTTNSAYSIENTLQGCTLDFDSNIESLNDKNTFQNVSPIPERNNSNFRNINSNRNIFMDNSSEDTCTINNLRNDNEQGISDKTNSTVTKDSTSNVPSIFLCSTSTKGTKWNKTKNEKAMKTPLQVINNVNLTPKNNTLIDKSNNTKLNTIPYDIQVTLTPSNKKFKQTKLVFHKIKKTMELSNNLKSTDTPTLTKTDITGTEKKKTNNEHDDNTYNQTEKVENAIEQYENNINLDQTIDSCNIDRTSSPLARFETESKYKNQNMKKRQTKMLKTKENVIKIIDLDEPEEKRI